MSSHEEVSISTFSVLIDVLISTPADKERVEDGDFLLENPNHQTYDASSDEDGEEEAES